MSPGALRLAAQPRVISTRHVACVRRLLYQGLWRHLGVGGDAEEDRQQYNGMFVILTTVSVAFVSTDLYFSLQTHTLVFLFKQGRMVVRA